MERYIQTNPRLNWQALVREAVNRRKTLGLTQKQLAVLADVSLPTLIRFEQGKSSITLENSFKILRMLGLLEEEWPLKN
ncbi:MAG: helix-turn-helix domain-containing protein [Alphaproteobacteria bacterium]|nr:helix-turn-helix domain-containing protein [Alphaproteobacteria bacterium]